MNLILLFKEDFISVSHVRISDQRHWHIQHILTKQIGDKVTVGLLGGDIGQAIITEINEHGIELEVELTSPPPAPLPLTLLLGLPRPKMLKRILYSVTTLGIKKIILINSYRVEKSYWQSPWLQPEKMAPFLHAGLEQARDTHQPEVILARRFKPFIEDELPALCAGNQCYVAHPMAISTPPTNLTTPSIVAVGPEGGFIEYEVEMLAERGFEPVRLGERILRVETAIPTLVGRMFNLT
ncbi:16S rRNA (uracil(1498)-N(3))-methyltransferase [Zooshikella harenae]|uniref:Ribosomal RNA small subunit methyltransferase E n=1 Tax=Zooshikella harenae TaxID=2827238 RepID=A0ABS5Z6C9_9GAMM|nr:16S rRNA (uracil(1498)-N(3))-methyltransferase [Zooshikella harenae]MBU2709598.1 16S rRNA (uracil(1498)-N(3))-methyltransferase [Zooshikella harenae]